MKNAKKFLSLAMVLMMVLSLAPTAVYADNTENLLTNGGFETVTEGSWPDDWDIPTGSSFNGTEKGTEAFVTKEVQHSGNNALQVNPSSSENRRVYQEVKNLTPGNFYVASVWVLLKGTNLTATNGIDLLVLRSPSNGWTNKLAGTTTNETYKLSTTQSKWTKMTTFWQQPADETVVYVAFDMGTNDVSETYCYFDDAEVREITGFDGGFETGFETVSTEKISDSESIELPHDVAFMHRNSSNFSAWAGEVKASKEAARSGEYGLHLITNPTGRRAFLYVPNLTAGKTYKLTAYMNVTKALSKGANIYVGPHFDKKAATNWYQGFTALAAATNGWVKKELVFTVDKDVDEKPCNYAYIQLYAGKANTDESADVYFDDITIEETNIKFTNAAGTELDETISTADTVNAKATVVGAEGDTACVFVGVYEKEGDKTSLVDLYIDTVTVSSKKWGEVTIEIPLKAGQYAKAMLLDGAASLKPLADAKTIEVK